MIFARLQRMIGNRASHSRKVLSSGMYKPQVEALEDRQVMSTTTVTPTLMDGWQVHTTGDSTVKFEQGPATPPLGTGSAEFRVDATGATAAQLRNTNYGGTQLADLTELKYWTYVEFNQNEQAPYIILNVDLDGNLATTADQDLLFFEPVYQDASFFPSNDQGNVLLNTWQDWDALNGGWWSVNGTAGAGPGADVKSLAVIIAAHPDAIIYDPITNTGFERGGVRIVAGFGGLTDWANFIGNADAFSIGVNGATDTYNFELYNSPTSKDEVKKGGWRNFDPNRPEGPFKNQGDAVSFIASKGKAKGNPGGQPSTHGNNGVGNGVDGQSLGNALENDGPGTAPGSPGRKGPK